MVSIRLESKFWTYHLIHFWQLKVYRSTTPSSSQTRQSTWQKTASTRRHGADCSLLWMRRTRLYCMYVLTPLEISSVSNKLYSSTFARVSLETTSASHSKALTCAHSCWAIHSEVVAWLWPTTAAILRRRSTRWWDQRTRLDLMFNMVLDFSWYPLYSQTASGLRPAVYKYYWFKKKKRHGLEW